MHYPQARRNDEQDPEKMPADKPEKKKKQITAERGKIEAELALANRIQMTVLPRVFPAYPDRTDFDIYASMTPAKEVGGDFYDFFLMEGQGNVIRRVYEETEDEMYYTATFEDGETTASQIMQEWYDELAKANGKEVHDDRTAGYSHKQGIHIGRVI